jgi:single-stranded-DNA-specific exonuclease
LAAGITIQTDRIYEFREKINEYARSLGARPIPQLSIDCKLSPVGAGERTAFALQSLVPHGCQNPAPVFGLMNMQIHTIQSVGNGKSLRLTLTKDGITVICMKFNTTMEEFPFAMGEFVDLAVAYRFGTFRNLPAFSLVVQDIRPAGFQDEEMFKDMLLFEEFMAGQDLSKEEKIRLTPSREDLAVVFRYLRSNQELNIHPDVLLYKMKNAVPLGKVFVALKVFEEFGFVRYCYDGDYFHTKFFPTKEKYDLSNSEILLKLQM